MKNSKLICRRGWSFAVCLVLVWTSAQAQNLQIESAAFHPEPTSHNSLFGVSTDVLGEWFAIGELGVILQGASFQFGRVSMYKKGPRGWTLSQTLMDPELWIGGQFGHTISIGEDVMAVGEEGYGFLESNLSAPITGRIAMFDLVGDQWQFRQYLRGVSPYGPTASFGRIMDMDGDWVVVGQSGERDHPTTLDRIGAVYCYQRQADGSWILSQRIPPPPLSSVPSAAWWKFGSEVRIGGDLMLISANNAGNTAGGAVFAYRLVAGTWALENQFVNPLPPSFNQYAYGRGLAIDGDRVAISAVSTNFGGNGAIDDMVVVFENQGHGNWVETDRVFAPGPEQASWDWPRFGMSLEMKGDWMWVGAPGGREAAGNDIGRCHLFKRASSGQWSEERQMRHRDRDPITAFSQDSLGRKVAADFDSGSLMAIAPNYRHWGPGGPSSNLAEWGGAYLFDLELGDRHCHGSANSTGQPSTLTLVGSRVVGESDLTLHGYNLPVGAFALCLYGQPSAAFAMTTGGNLCLAGGPVHRLFPVSQVGESGGLYYQIDFSDPGNMAALLPGTTWAFQVWHRDRIGGQSVTNTSSAMTLTLD